MNNTQIQLFLGVKNIPVLSVEDILKHRERIECLITAGLRVGILVPTQKNKSFQTTWKPQLPWGLKFFGEGELYGRREYRFIF